MAMAQFLLDGDGGSIPRIQPSVELSRADAVTLPP
jgi:hypothetical protein